MFGILPAGLNLFYVVLALIVLSWVWQFVTRRRRRTALIGFAEQREWSHRDVDRALDSRFTGEPFDRGSSRRASNVLEGRYEGRPFVAFDYSYVTRSSGGSGSSSSTTHRFSVVAIHLGLPPGTVLPRLQVSPQGVLGRFFSNLTGSDLQIGDPAFDDAFHVRTDSPALAQDVLTPEVTHLLLSHRGRAWRLEGDSLLLFDDGTHTPEEVDAVLAWGTAILERIPDPTWARLRGDG